MKYRVLRSSSSLLSLAYFSSFAITHTNAFLSLNSAATPILRSISVSAAVAMASPSQPSNDVTASTSSSERYRSDGVRILHDPYADGVAEHYGMPGATDPEGFDPYADTVGPGIYGGSVQKDAQGHIIIGQQYQNHNHKPGPVYDGKGYSLMSKAIHAGPETVQKILTDYPSLVHEISTGGATPLHICGMSAKGQLSTQVLVDAGADAHAVDTYGYTPLHRMASNNLAIGAQVLVERAGCDPNAVSDQADATPIQIAQRSRAIAFLMAMQTLGHYD